jgi:Tfp pilus assembly protein PilN
MHRPSFFSIFNRVYNDVFRTFTFSMQQSESFVSTRNYHITKKNQDNSFNFRYQNWERSTIEKTILD